MEIGSLSANVCGEVITHYSYESPYFLWVYHGKLKLLICNNGDVPWMKSQNYYSAIIAQMSKIFLGANHHETDLFNFNEMSS